MLQEIFALKTKRSQRNDFIKSDVLLQIAYIHFEISFMQKVLTLGIAMESPQPDEGSARTCNEKPDPFFTGNAQII